MRLHLFNPENDLALADGGFSYCAPPAAMCIARDLATLPLWYAAYDDAVFLPGVVHSEYYNEMSALFSLPKVYKPSMQQAITSLIPWGWSAQMRHRFKSMGFDSGLLPADECIEAIRNLSNRKLTIEISKSLRNVGIDTPSQPQYFDNIADVVSFVENCDRCVVKAPWSGSGKGIMWGIGKAEAPLVNFCKGIIKRQGGVVVEHFLNAQQEFAMEFLAGENGVEFFGYSLFTAENGAYNGNVLCSNSEIEKILSQFIPIDILVKVKDKLCGIMQSFLAGSGYRGYFGVDMMIYDNGDGYRLNPCMEVNLRMNMGVVARLFYDKYVAKYSVGNFFVKFFKSEGEAYSLHLEKRASCPLLTVDGRIVRGYLNLSPVTQDSRYIAYAIIAD